MDTEFSRQCFGPAWRFDEPAQFDFNEEDHPRHEKGASGGRGGEFARKGSNTAGRPGMAPRRRWTTKDIPRETSNSPVDPFQGRFVQPDDAPPVPPPLPPPTSPFDSLPSFPSPRSSGSTDFIPHKFVPSEYRPLPPYETFMTGDTEIDVVLVHVARALEEPGIAKDVADYKRRMVRANDRLEHFRQQAIGGGSIRVPAGEESQVQFGSDLAGRYAVAEEFLESVMSSAVARHAQVRVERNSSGATGAMEIMPGGERVIEIDPMMCVRSAVTEDQTVVHEFGHVLESSFPEIKRMCLAYLASRNNGDAPRSQEYRGVQAIGFRDDFGDTTQIRTAGRMDDPDFDAFVSVYNGMIHTEVQYAGGGTELYEATEVLSHGLENLFIDAKAFAALDPEYFKFTIGVLHGILL